MIHDHHKLPVHVRLISNSFEITSSQSISESSISSIHRNSPKQASAGRAAIGADGLTIDPIPRTIEISEYVAKFGFCCVFSTSLLLKSNSSDSPCLENWMFFAFDRYDNHRKMCLGSMRLIEQGTGKVALAPEQRFLLTPVKSVKYRTWRKSKEHPGTLSKTAVLIIWTNYLRFESVRPMGKVCHPIRFDPDPSQVAAVYVVCTRKRREGVDMRPVPQPRN